MISTGTKIVGMSQMSKRTRMGKHVSETRFGEKSVADLRVAADRLKELAEELVGYAEVMEGHELKTVSRR